uniref:Uncharacterized protein n=1 Tax=Aegilops tauschii subsp. strangulata TaxID=200361 RepID=A0A453LUD3_AEGTS
CIHLIIFLEVCSSSSSPLPLPFQLSPFLSTPREDEGEEGRGRDGRGGAGGEAAAAGERPHRGAPPRPEPHAG